MLKTPAAIFITCPVSGGNPEASGLFLAFAVLRRVTHFSFFKTGICRLLIKTKLGWPFN
jgi:hypothetical protein